MQKQNFGIVFYNKLYINSSNFNPFEKIFKKNVWKNNTSKKIEKNYKKLTKNGQKNWQ